MRFPTLRRDQATDDGFFPAPYSLDPLPHDLRVGLLAPAICGLLSALSTLALISFILQRLMMWRRHNRTFIGYNQYIMLVLNLLIADFQQSGAFLITWYWIANNRIVAPTAACFAQGWLLHSGDVSSALFVLAIAVHTFTTAIVGWKIRHKAFYSCIVVVWIIAYMLTAIGVGLHPDDYFVRAGAWCWVSTKYESERLWLHYLWVFLVEFTTITLYAITFFALRYKTNRLYKPRGTSSIQPNARTIQAINRLARLMTLYPCVYIMLTLPLSSGRMWSMAHDGAATSDTFSLTAGALLASCGWVDVLLYALTRKKLLENSMPRLHRNNSSGRGGITATRTVIVTDHGPLPRSVEEPSDAPADFLKEHGSHIFGEQKPEVRTGACLSETPPIRSGSADPMFAANVGPNSPYMAKQYDWKDILRGEPSEDIELGGEYSDSEGSKGRARDAFKGILKK